MAASVVSGLAGLLLLAALLLPNQLSQFTPAALLRIPAEGLLAVALVLALPDRARRVGAAIAGALIGVLALLRLFDLGFFSILSRPFDPVLDWPLVAAAVNFLRHEIGSAAATGVVIGAVVLGLGLLVLLSVAAVRLAGLLASHRSATAGVAGAAGVAWVVCALLGVQLVPGAPVAAHEYERAQQVSASLQDRRTFAAEAAVDDFRDVPGDQLLTALRGKDVVIAYVESYGRDAVADPDFAQPVGEVLAEGDRQLAAAGFDSRSGFLTAATSGGASWLNHATLRAGLLVDNQQRYRTLVSSDRFTINQAFQRAGWRTVAVMPGIFEGAWPEGDFFGFDEVYARAELDYQGPRMNWGIIPDQYTMSAFERFEHSATDRPPLLAEIALLSSHAPFTPVAPLLDWEDIDDGSVYETVDPLDIPVEDVLRDTAVAREAYGAAIGYSLATLISYVETFGDDDLVFILLGDHQPASRIVGDDATRDVPISLLTRDPEVLDLISGWGWEDGLRPSPQAPVWEMGEFRDQFLTAFSPPPPSGG